MSNDVVTGLVCGVFDVFHIGHVWMLKECKEHCDRLVVALNSAEHIDPHINPGKTKPIFPVEARKEVLESCRFVDEVLIYHDEKELYDLMSTNRFTIRFLGDDYRGKPITGSDLPISIHYIDRSHGWSSTKVKKMVSTPPKN